jgi:hypothetical protein
MRLLLDTHAFIWGDSEPDRLPSLVREYCLDRGNIVLLSVASVLEIVTVHGKDSVFGVQGRCRQTRVSLLRLFRFRGLPGQKWRSQMNERGASLDRSCFASGDLKMLNTETRTPKPVNGCGRTVDTEHLRARN